MNAPTRALIALAALAMAAGYDRLAPLALDDGLALLCRAIQCGLAFAALLLLAWHGDRPDHPRPRP